MAAAVGVDKIFGRGTTPAEVASYLVHALAPAAPARGDTALPGDTPDPDGPEPAETLPQATEGGTA